VIAGAADSITGTIAHRFEFEELMLVLRPFGPARFLLILPSSKLVDRIYNNGQAIVTTTLRLHVQKWTRFLNSMAASLPVAVEVDIQGIPAHAWELAMMELLLNEFC
jgi:hypothetical protein